MLTNKSNILITIIGSYLIISVGYAQLLSPEVHEEIKELKDEKRLKLIDGHISILGYKLLETDVEKVRKDLGATKFFKEDNVNKFCYRIENKKSYAYVVFGASAMEGYKKITEYEISTKPILPQASPPCLTVTKFSKKASSESKIGLFKDVKEVVNLLGNPDRIDKNRFTYKYLFRRRLRPSEKTEIEYNRKKHGNNITVEDFIDVLVVLKINFENSQIIDFQVYKTETF